MNSKTTEGGGLTVESLLDPSNPLVLWVVLPAAVLAALGLRKAAVFWVMAFVVWTIAKRYI